MKSHTLNARTMLTSGADRLDAWLDHLLTDLGNRVPTTPVGITAAVLYAALLGGGAVWVGRRVAAGRRQRVQRGNGVGRAVRRGARWSGERALIAVAIVVAIAVAGIGGARSFEAVSERFDSVLVPLIADGMIVACTALRLAALLRGWRLPGALATTYLFIVGTVWLNVASARDWADVIAHALAPLAYAVLVEFLAQFLRLHLGLVEPAAIRRGRSGGMAGMAGVAGLARLGWLTWVTSPLVTTRVGLHLARTGSDDPVATRALVQQLIRMSSRLRAVCPTRPALRWIGWLGWLPIVSAVGPAAAARRAALQTVRDGLLTSAELAALLPNGQATDGRHSDSSAGAQLSPGALLAIVDNAALRCTPQPAPASDLARTGAPQPVHRTIRTSALDLHRSGPAASVPRGPAEPSHASTPVHSRSDSDAALVAELLRHAEDHNGGVPMSQREVMRLLGVGTPKAKRLAVLAGWVAPNPSTAPVEGGREQPSPEERQLHVVHNHQPDSSHTDEQTDQQPNSDTASADAREEVEQPKPEKARTSDR